MRFLQGTDMQQTPSVFLTKLYKRKEMEVQFTKGISEKNRFSYTSC